MSDRYAATTNPNPKTLIYFVETIENVQHAACHVWNVDVSSVLNADPPMQ